MHGDGGLQEVESAARIAVRRLNDGVGAARGQLYTQCSQAAFGIRGGSFDDLLQRRLVQRLQDQYAAAREKRRVYRERGVLGGGADECHHARLHVGQQYVLLGPIEAVDLVDEEQSPKPDPPGSLDGLADLLDSGGHGRERLDAGIGRAGQ